MTKAYDSIRQGLLDAIDYAQGKPTGARVHHVEVPGVDAAAKRAPAPATRKPSSCKALASPRTANT
jgi:hypothetical protein